jgi:hypothetical protein
MNVFHLEGMINAGYRNFFVLQTVNSFAGLVGTS